MPKHGREGIGQTFRVLYEFVGELMNDRVMSEADLGNFLRNNSDEIVRIVREAKEEVSAPYEKKRDAELYKAKLKHDEDLRALENELLADLKAIKHTSPEVAQAKADAENLRIDTETARDAELSELQRKRGLSEQETRTKVGEIEAETDAVINRLKIAQDESIKKLNRETNTIVEREEARRAARLRIQGVIDNEKKAGRGTVVDIQKEGIETISDIDAKMRATRTTFQRVLNKIDRELKTRIEGIVAHESKVIRDATNKRRTTIKREFNENVKKINKRIDGQLATDTVVQWCNRTFNKVERSWIKSLIEAHTTGENASPAELVTTITSSEGFVEGTDETLDPQKRDWLLYAIVSGSTDPLTEGAPLDVKKVLHKIDKGRLKPLPDSVEAGFFLSILKKSKFRQWA